MSRYRSFGVLPIVIGLLFAAVPSFAHHSFAATYLEGEKMTVEADVVQFLFRNPHSFLQLTSKDAKSGEPITWAVEWGGGGQLGGIRGPGGHLLVSGAAGRGAHGTARAARGDDAGPGDRCVD